ncbi:putative fatty acyl-CoA reductase CG5065 [Anthonomus grandis grandis]|uniref:putative fatty acyl-CoA reductase CG5065 n=1 Tax=Anthonomus grandis grandis TaxID=2921223 RepID=UPI002165EC9B|nr:putative fatty acyl-CoA reductase CG5065 [Anthonomus grandis grandis]
MERKPLIKEYFKGKNIFITGGTGFVGKALIEKLLRSIPDIGNIYVLMREKKGKSIQERLQAILENPIFNVIKETGSDKLKKLIPIAGDTTQVGFGLSKSDRALLTNEIHIYFHGAASVRFDDFLKDAIFTNIRGAREAALLALEMKQIEVFVHISTSYCNTNNRKVVHEILYPPQGDWKEVIAVAETSNTEVLNILSQKYIEGFPNTYTYTKQLAEHCVNDLLKGRIPTVICRPSIVVSSYSEPFMGWVDNFNGPVGLLLAGVTAIFRVFYAGSDIKTEYIPVDNVVKLIIAAAWNKSISKDGDEVSIYHSSKYSIEDFTYKKYVEYGKRIRWDEPFENKLWFPNGEVTGNWLYFNLMIIIFHIIPALVFDKLLQIAGYEPRIVKLQRKIYIANMAVSYFTTHEWSFVDTKAQELFKRIPDRETSEFNFVKMPEGDKERYEYSLACCRYVRIHFLKENKTISKRSLITTYIFYFLHQTIKVFIFGFFMWMLLAKLDFANCHFMTLRILELYN